MQAAVAVDCITASCERHWSRWKHDCSGFVHSVAADFGVILHVPANAMIDQMSTIG